MPGNFSVNIEHFAEKHFVKSFEKKHQSHWESTWRAVVAELERVDRLLQTDKAETICDRDGTKIIKTKFKIAGSRESAKTSGNRCIVAWHLDKRSVSVLLVYNKTDLAGGNETARWKKIIKDNYPPYAGIF